MKAKGGSKPDKKKGSFYVSRVLFIPQLQVILKISPPLRGIKAREGGKIMTGS
jgi:hypothetical protein